MASWYTLRCTPYERDNENYSKTEKGTKSRFLNPDEEEVY